MPSMRAPPIIFVFNASIESGCDYVVQTMRLVAKTYPLFGLALGDIIFFPKLFTEKNHWIIRVLHGSIIIRPVSLLPGVRFRWVRMITYTSYALAVKLYMTLRYFGQKKVLWFFEPFHIPTLLRIFHSYVSVYDCVDYYPGFSDEAGREHAAVMKRAACIVANSEPLTKELKKVRSDVVCVPLGFADELFSNNVLSKHVRKKRRDFTVGYIGSISGRMDFSLIEKVAVRLPTIRFVFVGPLEEHVFGARDTAANVWKRICRLKNVKWNKHVSKSDIPAILSGFDIGIIPYRVDNSFNRFSFPMKTMEYFAAGKPVISTDIHALRRYEKRRLLFIGKTPWEFTRVICKIQKYGWSMRQIQKQRDVAFFHSWKNKVATIIRLVDRKGLFSRKY